MTFKGHDEVAARLIDYVLGETTAEETRSIEAHVRVCADCAAEVREWRDVLAGLASTIPARAPEPALRARVLAAVARAAEERFGITPPTVVERSPVFSGWHRASLAAGLAAIVALAISLYLVNGRRHVAMTAATDARVEAERLQSRLRDYGGQTDLALAILAANDMRQVRLSDQHATGPTGARAFWSPTRGLLVVADRLPILPDGRIYQVWVIAGERPASAGLLGNPDTGRGMLIVPPPREGLTGSVTVAVTDEPPGGLSAPSGTIHLSGST